MNSRYRTADGTCNNMIHPAWGAANRPFIRLLPSKYDDYFNLYRVRGSGFLGLPLLPNTREVSLKMNADVNVTNLRITNMVPTYGQFLNHDITLTPQAGQYRVIITIISKVKWAEKK
jgi:peroxidase